MLHIEIPGRAPLSIQNIALDYNGTIAADGALSESIRARISALCPHASVYVLTADTYGSVQAQCRDLGVTVMTFPKADAGVCKAEIVRQLSGSTVCLGNGYNDIQMFDIAALSIAVLDAEGICASLLPHADVLVRSAEEGLDLLLKPDRLRATLRT
ncbi:MAG: ATPase P [Clostridia bacterium]|nr:ATPase P [Clostridia bacterium]